MNAKQNFLETIRFGKPEYVAMSNEPIWFGFSFEEISKMETWTDRWQVRWDLELEGMVPFPKGNPLADINNVYDYIFPDPDTLVLSDKTKRELLQAKQDGKMIMGQMSYFVFERAWALVGMENFLIAMIENPNEINFLLKGVADYAKRVFERYVELGADCVSFSEDLGSQRALMMSPTLFREYLLPRYDDCFRDLIKNGTLINFHSCGCIEDIVSDLANIGVHILNPIQAKANDLKKLKEISQGRIVLSGGIDTHTLMTGTAEQVRIETLRVLEILKPGGGYILSPDQFLPDMPVENMNMMWETCKSYGKYSYE